MNSKKQNLTTKNNSCDTNFKLNYNNVLVFGYSTSGRAVVSLLQKLDVDYKVYDEGKNFNHEHKIKKLNSKTLQEFDLIVISPGVSIYHKLIAKALELDIKVVSELEFGYWFTKSKIIAITGTNGKTTTTSLINHVLNHCGVTARAFGNIGEPLTNIRNYKGLEYVIVEVSSFQLEAIDAFTPDIAVVLNIGEDHLDRHKTMENYIASKLQIFKNANSNTISIVNFDCDNLSKNIKNIKGDIWSISENLLRKVDCNKSLDNDNNINTIVGRDDPGTPTVGTQKGIYIRGKHYVVACNDVIKPLIEIDEITINTFSTNIMATLLVAHQLGLDMEVVVEAINSYKSSEHRMESVAVVEGVEYINDSKATNIHATLGAVTQVKEDVVLLLGGLNKDLAFDEFFIEIPNNVKSIVAFGKARKQIYKSCSFFCNVPIFVEKTLENAVFLAKNIAKSDEVVLFSPACASFDAYKSYAERGNHFKALVLALNSPRD